MRHRTTVLMAALTLSCGAGVRAQLPPTPSNPATSKGPQLFVAQRIQDLGSMFEGDKTTVTWTLENRGDADLIVDRVMPSCGCTVVQLTDEEKVIRPGASLPLRADFDSTAKRESQVKTISVLTNDAVESELKLELRVKVEVLFETDPATALNLRAVRRGVAGTKAIDFFPGPGRSSLAIRGVEVAEGDPLVFGVEPVTTARGAGQRVKATVPETASLGSVNSVAKVRVEVDGIERERLVPIRGEVIADLSWLPKVVDATRQQSLPGKKFAPITVSAAEKTAFEIVEVSAGPFLEAVVEPGKNPASKSEYNVVLVLRGDAPPGPFAAMLKIQTTSLDQPILEVPVFGVVAPPVEVEPAAVLLRGDGSAAGAVRRVIVRASVPSQRLEIKELTCDDPAVTVRVDEEASSRYTHLKFLEVRLRGDATGAPRKAVLRLTTGVPGAERIEIPVAIESGAGKKP